MALHSPRQSSTSKPSLAYRRLVVKAGTSVLTNRTESLDGTVMASLVAQIVELRGLGAQVVLVTSGAVAAGRQALGERRTRTAGG